MQIQVNPRSLLNLEHICEVLYKLHPSVLNYLIEMERSLGKLLGTIDLDNLSLEEREFLSNNAKEVDFSKEPVKTEEPKTQEDFYKMLESKGVKVHKVSFDNKNDAIDFLERFNETNEKSKLLSTIRKMKEHENACRFHNLRKYIQLDSDEYIPMKIYVEVEDPVIGKKVKELVEALEKTRAPEQFYFNKKELDEDAYFAEGYGLTMNEEQKKKNGRFFLWRRCRRIRKTFKREKVISLIFIFQKYKNCNFILILYENTSKLSQ